MKVSINSPVLEGAYGGGMSFVLMLHKYLTKEGVEVVSHLNDNDIDIILHVNVTYTYSYSFYKALLYKMHHPRVIIVHRVNDSGYQRRNELMTKLMTLCSKSSDHLIYNSLWVKNQMWPKLKSPLPSSIILNGYDLKTSNFPPKIPWDGKSKLKIVTHHWSSNYEKGHDFYQALDKLLDDEDFKNKYEFTYIGNYPTNLEYRNTKLLPVMKKNELMKELRNHHIYLTGSKNEAAGYHVIEGISSGLPILYYDSGGVPEYSRGCGLKFTDSNFEGQFNKMRQEYFNYLPVVEKTIFSGQLMAKNYLSLFENLLNNQKLSSDQYDSANSFYVKKYFLFYKDITLDIYKHVYAIPERILRLLKRH